jgi:hypothetical protein
MINGFLKRNVEAIKRRMCKNHTPQSIHSFLRCILNLYKTSKPML